LLQKKSKKQLILTGAARFNSKPKTGLAFLEENKLIYADLSEKISKSRSLAIFLKGSNRIDKRLLGDFLSKPDNIDLLKEYISLFDFKDVGRSLCERLILILMLSIGETYCGGHQGASGSFSITRRIPTNISDC